MNTKWQRHSQRSGETSIPELTTSSSKRDFSRKLSLIQLPTKNAVSLNLGRKHLNIRYPKKGFRFQVALLGFLAIAFLCGTTLAKCSMATQPMPVVLSSTKTVSESPDLAKLLKAIEKAEGSKRYPYGIRSVRCTLPTTCREIAQRTIRNTYKRWVKDGSEGDFLAYLANRYAPIGADNDPRNLNANWLKNVSYFMGAL